jgi:hypothetical protein
MAWFAVACAMSGLAIGLLTPSVVAIALTSFQLLLIVLSLWLSDEILANQIFLWSAVGLIAHQWAYVAAALVHARVASDMETPLRFEVESEFDLMDSLARRIEARAPEVGSEAATLARLAQKMRQMVMNECQLRALLLETRKRG